MSEYFELFLKKSQEKEINKQTTSTKKELKEFGMADW